MKKVVILLALTVGMTSPALAAMRVSVEQLEHLLANAKGQSDGKVAKQLSDLELTERASSARLERWKTAFPGRRSREALTILTDASAFLDLPAADMPAVTRPDRETQKAMLAKTIDYVGKSTTRLPNFYATRMTQHFEGGLSGPMGYTPFHSSGKSSTLVAFRDGYELANSRREKIDLASQPEELTTIGEFGPVLTMLLGDAMQGGITWGFWQQDANGNGENKIEAVFRYTVPKDKSRYFMAMRSQQGWQADNIYPAYHGEIAIDPANGDILRITIVADLPPPDEKVSAAVLVEYGATSIGGISYICPLKGLAIYKRPLDVGPAPAPAQAVMNDITFSGYHLFRAEVHIVTGDSGSTEAPPEPK